jgi:hypothetical protein
MIYDILLYAGQLAIPKPGYQSYVSPSMLFS